MSAVIAERLVRRVPQPVPAPVVPDEDDWTHLFCKCSPDVAFCGKDIAAEVELPEDAVTDDCPLCVLARELQPACPRCGRG